MQPNDDKPIESDNTNLFFISRQYISSSYRQAAKASPTSAILTFSTA